jgi:hypothetical protein
MSRVVQLIHEHIDFDSRLRNPVHWFIWMSTASFIAVTVFGWRPPEVLEPLFLASIFLSGLGAIILLLLYMTIRSLGSEAVVNRQT